MTRPPLNPWLEDRLWAAAGDGPVLDLGCGRGDWLGPMVARGVAAIGVEHDPARAATAGRRAPVVAGDGARLPLATASVGVVWCVHVLHHLPRPEAVLAEVVRVLRPGGVLVLAETVEDNPLLRLARRVRPEFDGVGVHARFTAAALLADVGAAGFEVEERRQHSLVSFAAWGLPAAAGRRAWDGLTRVEALLPGRFERWGAHLEVVARRRG